MTLREKKLFGCLTLTMMVIGCTKIGGGGIPGGGSSSGGFPIVVSSQNNLNLSNTLLSLTGCTSAGGSPVLALNVTQPLNNFILPTSTTTVTCTLTLNQLGYDYYLGGLLTYGPPTGTGIQAEITISPTGLFGINSITQPLAHYPNLNLSNGNTAVVSAIKLTSPARGVSLNSC